MVFKKSQYTHDYKVPHWNRHYNHYKEKVDYRVQRRVLEYQHEPFEWQDPDSDWEHELEDDRMSDSAYDGGTQLERCEKLHRHREREVQTPAWEKRDDIQIEKNNNLNNSNAYQVPPLPASALERNDKPIRPKKPRPKSAKATVGGAEKSAIRPPFLPYGYMDKERHVGTQRTHNVKATVADVSKMSSTPVICNM
ncbi:uncharacterized protein LOC102801965 [Saccoglossus kowalevskii]|uniref:Uncharacterized protein LOC102801965 n=1 Tax=Saccoglossus kowalevskii TaxID=10224 RepID=A0ABM0M158_SACKO|nr:PREDICTED: uncharacterized protein LOC102801965 [Saccoglossus kowalevskii]